MYTYLFIVIVHSTQEAEEQKRSMTAASKLEKQFYNRLGRSETLCYSSSYKLFNLQHIYIF